MTDQYKDKGTIQTMQHYLNALVLLSKSLYYKPKIHKLPQEI